MKAEYRKLGEFIRLVDERNESLVSTEVLGISIDKEFMPSVANTICRNEYCSSIYGR